MGMGLWCGYGLWCRCGYGVWFWGVGIGLYVGMGWPVGMGLWCGYGVVV